MINGYGMVNGFELHVQDKTGKPISELDDATKGFIAALSQCPEIGTAYTAFSSDYPQYTLDIDAARCERSGISPAEVLSTVSGYYGGQYVSNFNRFSKLYRVMIQAEPDTRVTPESLNHLYVRTGNGEMAPISQFAGLPRPTGHSRSTASTSMAPLWSTVRLPMAILPAMPSVPSTKRRLRHCPKAIPTNLAVSPARKVSRAAIR